MTQAEIEQVVVDILITDGPDGHCDGSEVITSFIMALLDGKGAAWKKAYRKLNHLSA